MKKYIVILSIIAASCSEEEFSPCYVLKQQSVEAYKVMKAAEGTADYAAAKAEYLSLKNQAAACYDRN